MNIFGMVHTKVSEKYTWISLKTFFENTKLSGDDTFILIDNDRSLQPSDISARFPQVVLWRSEQPRSYSENGNLFLKLAIEKKADLFFMNNDLVFSPDWITPLLIDQKAIFSPVCNMQFDYKSKNIDCKVAMDLSDYLGNEAEFLQIVKHHHTRHSGYKLEHSFPFYCVKIPYSVSSEIGLLDETYCRGGFEDTDYILRCYLRNIPLYFSFDSFILHFYGKSTWRPENNEELRVTLEKDRDKGTAVFLQRWGKPLYEAFCLHKPEAMENLKRLEEQAVIRFYGSVIDSWRPKGAPQPAPVK